MSTVTDTRLAEKALTFQRAWDAAKAADAAHAHAAEKAGDCKHFDFENFEGMRCYRSDKPQREWCPACRKRQPFYKAAAVARRKATGAMKSMLNLARRIKP